MDTAAYESHHRHPFNRGAHVAGIPIIVAGIALGLWPGRVPFGIRRSAALGSAVAGWGLLFLGHAVEGNRPVVLSNPEAVWSALRWWLQRIRCAI